MPAGAIDTHAHLFGPASRYAYSETRSYTPPDANIEAYRALHRALRVERGVLIQPSVYGTINARVLDALREEPDRLRAVAAVEAGVSLSEKEGTLQIMPSGRWPAFREGPLPVEWFGRRGIPRRPHELGAP
jgi:predicted TIM-barrel fold metal-dependent hydrolase